jgi:methanogenic corrinoid protein MtbC1
MVRIGEEWQEGSRSVADEHRASALVPSLLGRLRVAPRPSGRKRGLVIVGCPSTEEHGIAAAIFEELLRARRFAVQNLGANTPALSFVEVCEDADRLVAVAFSVSVATSLEGLRASVDELRLAGFEVPLIVGGGVVADLSAEELGVDHVVSGFREGLDLVETLVGS